jgi:hypothetical protein
VARGKLIIKGKPPALPGDSQSLTVPGVWAEGRASVSVVLERFEEKGLFAVLEVQTFAALRPV